MKRLPFLIFHAADDGGPQVAIPAAQSPTGQQIDITPRTPPPPAEIHQAPPEPPKEPRVRQSGVKLEKADVIASMNLAEAPSESIKKLAELAREKATGRFAKKPPEEKAKKAAAAPVTKTKEPAATTEKPPAAAAAPAPKVKIGDKEYSQEELATLIAKAETPAEQKPEAEAKPLTTPAKPEEKQPEEDESAQIAAQQKSEQEWLEKKVKEFNPADYGIKLGERELDTIISGGPRAVTAFAQLLARVAAASELNARKWAAKHLSEVRGAIQPQIEERATISKYQEEHKFLTANPDIQAHGAKGVIAMREVAAELHEQYDALALAVSQNPANAWAKSRLEKLEKDFLGEVATATKAKLAGTPPPAAPAKPEAKPAMKSRPPAQTGNVSMAGAAPTKKTGASAEIAELEAAGY